ncbi:multidrug DMT transporter permease, partial [Vibrio parahaemolyticus]|uniref:multidrug DMT transporter permease n=1 Tax=Vibrio parahaemolyticus TaxID=670 RepID=UPI00215CD9B7
FETCIFKLSGYNNPKDMLGTYLLLFTIIIFIVNRQFNISVSIMPWLTLKTFLITILVTYVSFMLFPGDEQDIKADEKAMSGAKTHLGLIAFKSTILMIVMYLLISTESSQSLLIAITVGSMIKIPISRDQRIFRNNRLIATLVGILATLPIMVAQYFFVVSQWMLIGISCFMGLQMARFAIWRKCKLSVYQLMFTNFIVLLNQIFTYHGNQPFSVEITRFASISIAILFATIILNFAQFCATSHSGPR